MYFVAIVPHVQKRTLVLAVVVVLHIAYGIWNIEVLEKHQTKGIGETIHTDEANFRLSLNDGILVQDYKWRSIYQSHQVAKFNQRWMHYGQPLENPTQETHRPSKRENP